MAKVTDLNTASAEDARGASVWDQLDDAGRRNLLIALVCVLLVGAIVALRVRVGSERAQQRRDWHTRSLAREEASKAITLFVTRGGVA